METAEIEQLVEELETRIDRLRALYEQYFMGIEKIEPGIARKDVERRIQTLRREQIRNTGVRFRFQMLIQKFSTYQQYWNRICRRIEEGTYKRTFGVRARNKSIPPPEMAEAPPMHELSEADFEEAPASLRGASLLSGGAHDLADEIDALFSKVAPGSDSHSRTSPSVPGETRRPSHPAMPRIQPQAYPPRHKSSFPPEPARPSTPPRPRSSVPPAPVVAAKPSVAPPAANLSREERMRLLAQKIRTRPDAFVPAVPSTNADPPTAHAASAKTAEAPAPRPPVRSEPRLAAVEPPEPRPAAARPPAAAAPTAPADLSDKRIREIYNQYVETRRTRNESTAAITFDALARSLRDSTTKLKEKHGGKKVDFEVTVKDGKTVLKPIVK